MRYFEFVQEGVHDPAIFKIIFVIGGPGSGKSFITKKLGLSALGYTTVNSDIAFEYLMKKHHLDPKMPEVERPQRDVVRQRAKDITANKSELAIEGRLGIVIDGTGDDYEKISKLKGNFDALGYNSFLVVVNTKLDVARQRNKQRQRTVPDDIVVQSWYAVQNNIGKFSQIFENVAIIDNSGDGPGTESQIQNAYKKLIRFTNSPPNKPIAKQWIHQHSQTNEAEEGTPHATDIAQEFAALGYKKLGSGADAHVWAADKDYVIKILMPEQSNSKAVQIFQKFYEFCKAHQDLSCLPRVNEVNTIDILGKEYTQIDMERLYPLKKGSFEEGVVWFFSDFVTQGATWEQTDTALGSSTEWYYYNKRLANKLADTWQNLSMIQGNEQKYKEFETLYKVMGLLYKTSRINKFGWDLHTENAMMRRDGTIVITDPWFETYSSI